LVFTFVFMLTFIVMNSSAQLVQNGLISYWSFDQATINGATVKDLVGKNNGTMKGNPKVVNGKVGQALQFNGSTDYVDCGDDASLQVATGFTMEAWIYITNYPQNCNTIITKWDDDADQRGYMFNFGEGGEAGAGANELSVIITESGSWNVHCQWGTRVLFDKDKWYHVVITHDSTLAKGNVKAYVDGDFKADKDWAFKVWPSTAKLLIGGYDGPGNGLNGGSNSRWTTGMIDEPCVYNRALSANEVKQNYNAKGLAVDSAGKLTFTWGMIKGL